MSDEQPPDLVDQAAFAAGMSRGVLFERIYDPAHKDMYAAFMAGKHARDWEGIDGAIGEILKILDLDHPEYDEHFRDTPKRVEKMLRSFVEYTEEDLVALLKAGFEETQDNILVSQRDIPFSGLCAHHLLPFWGTAAVGYIPRKRVVGLSKLARLVAAAGRVTPSTQEHITNLIADTLAGSLEPIGVGVITTAAHGCMAVRGVNAPQTVTQVNAFRGQILLNSDARQEFLQAAGVVRA